jgi:hypothetical protein
MALPAQMPLGTNAGPEKANSATLEQLAQQQQQQQLPLQPSSQLNRFSLKCIQSCAKQAHNARINLAISLI